MVRVLLLPFMSPVHLSVQQWLKDEEYKKIKDSPSAISVAIDSVSLPRGKRKSMGLGSKLTTSSREESTKTERWWMYQMKKRDDEGGGLNLRNQQTSGSGNKTLSILSVDSYTFLSLHQVNRRQDMKQLLNNSRHGTMLLDLEEKERQSLTLPIFACLWSLYGREKCPEGGEEKREEDAREGGAERGAERGEGEAEEALHDIITGIIFATDAASSWRILAGLGVSTASCCCLYWGHLVPAQIYLLNHC